MSIVYVLTSVSKLEPDKKLFWCGHYWDPKFRNGVKFYKDLAWAMKGVNIATDKTVSQRVFIEKHLTEPIENVKSKTKRSWFVQDVRVEAFELLSLGTQDENNFYMGIE